MKKFIIFCETFLFFDNILNFLKVDWWGIIKESFCIRKIR